MPISIFRLLSYLLLFVLVGMWGYGAISDQIQYVFLWTDILIYLLVIVILLFGFYASKKDHLRLPWKHVFSRPIAMMALVFLLTYVILGLLDSVHFREALEKTEVETQVHYSGEVTSAFDVLLQGISKNQEKSYSRPFATHLLSKEFIETESGRIRDYPRLTHAGSHLKDPEDKANDIFIQILKAVSQTVVFVVLISLLLAVDLSRKYGVTIKAAALKIIKGETEVPWREMILALAMIALVVFFVANLGTYYHIMGTDKVGQDVLVLSLKSIRTGLVIGTLTTLIMLPFAIALGMLAGYFKGWVDDIIQFVYTTLSSIPGVLLIAAAVLSLQVYLQNNPDLYETALERADLRLLFLCGILGITSWTGLCRLLRGESLKLSELDYVNAAQAFGVRQSKILVQHILPNVMHIVLISVVLDFSGLVLAEAVLSYVGVGVDPSTVSWGNMINSARLEMAREPLVWWSLVSAFIFMFALVLSANLFSDAVRDAFDPRLVRAR